MSHPAIEVRAACKDCKSTNTKYDGRSGDLIYRVCQECNCHFKVLRIGAHEIADISLVSNSVKRNE